MSGFNPVSFMSSFLTSSPETKAPKSPVANRNNQQVQQIVKESLGPLTHDLEGKCEESKQVSAKSKIEISKRLKNLSTHLDSGKFNKPLIE